MSTRRGRVRGPTQLSPAASFSYSESSQSSFSSAAGPGEEEEDDRATDAASAATSPSGGGGGVPIDATDAPAGAWTHEVDPSSWIDPERREEEPGGVVGGGGAQPSDDDDGGPSSWSSGSCGAAAVASDPDSSSPPRSPSRTWTSSTSSGGTDAGDGAGGVHRVESLSLFDISHRPPSPADDDGIPGMQSFCHDSLRIQKRAVPRRKRFGDDSSRGGVDSDGDTDAPQGKMAPQEEDGAADNGNRDEGEAGAECASTTALDDDETRLDVHHDDESCPETDGSAVVPPLTADALSKHDSLTPALSLVRPSSPGAAGPNKEDDRENGGTRKGGSAAPGDGGKATATGAPPPSETRLRPGDARPARPSAVSPEVKAFLADASVQQSARHFAMEHRIFLRAILQLLAEREEYALETADPNDPHTIKTGPLKKASHLMRGVWKVKYVEIRKGLFSYYEDAPAPASSSKGAPAGGGDGAGNGGGAGELRRKSLPLRANACTCRAVKVSHKAMMNTGVGFGGDGNGGGGAIFELAVEGVSKRLWMANSREERQSWIHAIHDAMLGGSVTRGHSYLDYQEGGKSRRGVAGHRRRRGSGSGVVPPCSPYKSDLETYMSVQASVRAATSKDLYTGALAGLVGSSLTVPVQWIKEQVEGSPSSSSDSKTPNGKSGPGGGGGGSHAAFQEGCVSSGIEQLWKDMLRDSVSINGMIYKGDAGHGPERILGALIRSILKFDRSHRDGSGRKRTNITEAQAVSYARDILLACNRTRSGGDSYYCVDTLCSNPNGLVVICPSSMEAEPLTIVVLHATATVDGQNRDDINDGTPSSPGGKEGTAIPTPSSNQRGLSVRNLLGRGSFTVSAPVAPPNRFLQRQLAQRSAFDVRSSLCESADSAEALGTTRECNEYADGKTKVGTCNNATTASDGSHDRGGTQQNAVQATRLSSGGSSSSVKATRSGPTVQVSVRASAEYKVCTTDPQGNDGEDTWAMLRTSFLQSFQLSSGPTGRIVRGEERVRIDFLEQLLPSFSTPSNAANTESGTDSGRPSSSHAFMDSVSRRAGGHISSDRHLDSPQRRRLVKNERDEVRVVGMLI